MTREIQDIALDAGQDIQDWNAVLGLALLGYCAYRWLS
jgi:hypothetical protein